MIRAFIALSIAETLERQLSLHAQSLALQLNREALRWVPSENYHITLAFLGDIKSQDLAKLETIMDAVASHHPITTLQIDDVQWFPSVHKPRLLVATVAANSALQKLQQALVNQLRQHGFAVENIYHIVITCLSPAYFLGQSRTATAGEKISIAVE